MVQVGGFIRFMGIHWIDLFVGSDNITYFDSYRVEFIPKIT